MARLDGVWIPSKVRLVRSPRNSPPSQGTAWDAAIDQPLSFGP